MTVQVSNPAFVYDLLASLKRANYSASLSGDTTVEVSIPPAATIDDDPVVVAHRRTAHKGAQLPAVPLRPGLTRIDEAPAHGEQGTPPPFAAPSAPPII